MLDTQTLQTLAAGAVALLTSLLGKAAETGAEEIGKSTAVTVIDKLKNKLKHEGANEALNDLTKNPDAPDMQAALRVQLGKAIGSDPNLSEFITNWLSESASKPNAVSITQSAIVHGNDNITAQNTGSGNSISVT